MIRVSARRAIAEAAQLELDEFLGEYDGELTESGLRRVVRNGHHRERCIQTGVGPVSVKIPKVRSVSGEPVSFRSALEEIFPGTRQQRCWVHKISNVLNRLPKAIQPRAKSQLHEIYMAETREDAHRAFDVFVAAYRDKYPWASENLLKDREELLAFYDFPAEHWQSIRTTNPIGSAFATIRHRTRRSKGCLNRNSMLCMNFKLGQSAELRWRRLRGFKQLGKVIEGIQFNNGIEVKKLTDEQMAA